MNEQNIIAIHDALYEYLLGLHHANHEFRFRIRPKDDERFRKGYWFYGDESSINISFWKGNINNTHTIHLYLPIDLAKNIYCNLEYVDKTKTFIQKMSKKLEFSNSNYYPNYYKQIQNKNHYINTLKYFIENEKQSIDEYLRQNPNDDVVGFIDRAQFESDFARVEAIRNSIKNPIIQGLKDQILADAKLRENITNECLPNALSRIYISNFQGIKELCIEGLPLTSQWIFITGENGFGKTSVLRAIAKGLIGDESFVAPSPKEATILVNAVINGQPFNNQFDTSTPNLVSLATYGVSRFRLVGGDATALERSQQKTYSLFHDDGQLYNIEQQLINYNAYDKPRFEKLKSIFLRLIPHLKDIAIEPNKGKPKVIYHEKDDNNQLYEAVSLNDLAAGFRNILTMVGDMVMRLSEKSDNLEELSGIVLIDEIDAHLHPKYQYELPKLLAEVFPKVQFIATTHSPIPILGLPKNNKPVILTVERNAENGITIDRKDDDFNFRQLSPEALLTSPIFSFQTLFARDTTADEVMPTSDFNEVIEISAIQERIKKLREEGLVK